MKRKVVEQGGVTLMLSLPRKWTKKHSLKKGDEVEIQEKDRDLVISPATITPEVERYHVDLTNLHPLINYGLTALFVRGIDELEIVSKNPEYIEKLQEKPINQFIGYEIIEQSKNRCVVKDLSGAQDVDFTSLFRRIFLLLIAQGEEMIKAAEEENTKVSHVISIDLNINRFCFHCMRMLNKRGFTDFRHTSTMYLLVATMEDIGDVFKTMAEYVQANRVTFTEQQIAVLKKCFALLKEYQGLFFKFDVQRAAELDAHYRKLRQDFEDCMKQTKSPAQIRGLLYWQEIMNLVARMLRNQLIVTL